jgi:hypothetical protein
VNRPRADGFIRSIQDRLKNEAHATNRPFAEMLELFAVERFLHRLGRSQHRDRFVLKGALLLRHWLGADTRPTRDIDLLGPIDLDTEWLRALIGEILRLEVEEDGLEFDLDSISVRSIRLESPVLGIRARFDAHLGRARLRYQIDVGQGDAVFPPAEDVIPGGLLGLPMASVRAYTPYTAIAEKLEAMVILGNANSRLKDYYDLAMLPARLAFDGPTLVESIRRTFGRRVTRIPDEPLEGLTDSFAREPINSTRWRAFLGKGRLTAVSSDLLGTVASIRGFAQPALDAAREALAFHQRWPAGGPWEVVS